MALQGSAVLSLLPIAWFAYADMGEVGDNLGVLARSVIHDRILAYLRAASSCWSAAGSTGLTKWALNPASCERLRSSSCPQPVTATRTMSLPHGCSRIRRAAS